MEPSNFLPKSTVRKGRERKDCIVELPDESYLGQVVKVNINSDITLKASILNMI